MSHKKFDDKAKSAFDEINDQNIPEGMLRKEAVWDSLDINEKKTNPYRWLMWLMLGLLLIIGGVFINDRSLSAEEVPEVHFANADTMKKMEIQIAKMKSELDKMSAKYVQKDGVIDSLHLSNQVMQQKLELLASKDALMSASKPNVINSRDTIYITEFEEKNIIQEKIVRDTVFIEVPVMQELMVDKGTNQELSNENLSAGINSVKEKPKPTSIQFNFSKIKSEKK